MSIGQAVAVLVHGEFTPQRWLIDPDSRERLAKGRYLVAYPGRYALAGLDADRFRAYTAAVEGKVFVHGWRGDIACIDADEPWITLLDDEDREVEP